MPNSDIPRAHIRCDEKLVKQLTDENSLLATTINSTGVTRLALDWLEMKQELLALRKKVGASSHRAPQEQESKVQ